MVMPTHIVAAAGVVENDRGEILLVKTHRSGWVFPGGQVENGENIIDAVIREIQEESGIDAQVNTLFAIYSNTASYKGYNGVEHIPTKVMMDFICTYVDGEPRGSDETSESQWVKKDDALGMIEAPAMKERFMAYLNFNGAVQYLEYVTKPEFELRLKRDI